MLCALLKVSAVAWSAVPAVQYNAGGVPPPSQVADAPALNFHFDFWWIGALQPSSVKLYDEIRNTTARGYSISLGPGINHPPAAVREAARYFNSDGQQARQLSEHDGTGVNYVFRPSLWPRIDAYFAALAARLSQRGVPLEAVRVVRLGMDVTGEFNYPYADVQGGGSTNNSWWAFLDENGTAPADYPAALAGWKPQAGRPEARPGQATMFVQWYYAKLAAFQNFLVNASRTHFPFAAPAVLYPGSSAEVTRADANAAAQLLAHGVLCKDAAQCHRNPISSGWCRAMLVPALGDLAHKHVLRPPQRPIVWGTCCEQQQAFAPLAALAHSSNLSLGCENTGGYFDSMHGAMLGSALRKFFGWAAAHSADVTFLLAPAADFAALNASVVDFMGCEQQQLVAPSTNLSCVSRWCPACSDETDPETETSRDSGRQRGSTVVVLRTTILTT